MLGIRVLILVYTTLLYIVTGNLTPNASLPVPIKTKKFSDEWIAPQNMALFSLQAVLGKSQENRIPFPIDLLKIGILNFK